MNREVENDNRKALAPIRAMVRPIAIGAVVAAIGSAGAWLLRDKSARSPSLGIVSIPAGCLNFGKVWSQDTFQWPVRILNTTNTPVKIRDLKTSCRCTSIEPHFAVVPAFGEVEFRLNLDLRPRDASSVGPRTRLFHVNIAATVEADDSKEPAESSWRIEGGVRDALSLSRSSVQFDENALIEGEPFPAEALVVQPLVALRSLNAECDGDQAIVTTSRNASGNNQFTVSITPRETLRAGSHVFDVMLHAVRDSGEVIPPLRVEVVANVQSRIRASPSALILTGIMPGTTAEEIVILEFRTGRRRINVESASCESDDVSVLPVDEEWPRSAARYRVCVHPVQHTRWSGCIHFNVLDPIDSSPIVLSVPVSYYSSQDTTVSSFGKTKK